MEAGGEKRHGESPTTDPPPDGMLTKAAICPMTTLGNDRSAPVSGGISEIEIPVPCECPGSFDLPPPGSMKPSILKRVRPLPALDSLDKSRESADFGIGKDR